ncbi:MAG: hypothetical protein LBE12_02010 [Planctomycetaceae bacterium]|nr:hypothetical protein [Planctomycetaceae bacterium]
MNSVAKRNYCRLSSNPHAALSTINFPLSTIIHSTLGDNYKNYTEILLWVMNLKN